LFICCFCWRVAGDESRLANDVNCASGAMQRSQSRVSALRPKVRGPKQLFGS
jgi:hypothetical protein